MFFAETGHYILWISDQFIENYCNENLHSFNFSKIRNIMEAEISNICLHVKSLLKLWQVQNLNMIIYNHLAV